MKKNLLIVLIGSLGLIILVAILFLILAPKTKAPTISNNQDSTDIEISEFGLTIPENPETKKFLLTNSEGDLSADAYILRKNERLYVYIYANLPLRLDGSVYKAWLFDGNQKYEYLADLKARDDKYVLEYETENLNEDKKVLIVTLNEKDNANLGEQILIGSI